MTDPQPLGIDGGTLTREDGEGGARSRIVLPEG